MTRVVVAKERVGVRRSGWSSREERVWLLRIVRTVLEIVVVIDIMCKFDELC